MFSSRSTHPSFVLTGLAVGLMLASQSCGDGGDGQADSGAACAASACEGMAVPEIACADGPTLVVCERDTTGACRAQVRCGGSEDAGGAPGDGGSKRDAGGTSTGQTCGGIAGLACSKSAFCNYEVSAGGTGCQGTADASGVCQALPQACTEEYAPVCGCDRHSYSSACDAHAHGIAVLHKELCTAEECTGIGGRPVYSDGASTPACKSGETGFAIPGREPALCCVP